MANQLPPGRGQRAVEGTIDRVPCPHCGKALDFRTLQSESLLDTGHQMFCDYCGRSLEVVRIITKTFVAVRQDPSGKVRPAAQGGARRLPAQQQRLQKPGLLSRLLGKG